MMEKQVKSKRPRATRRAAEQGMTLIEIMIVVIIMATIATGVAVAVVPAMGRANVKQAATDANSVRSAVMMYVAENPGKCPSMDDLKSGKFIDKTKRTTDPWDKEFVIRCTEGDDPEVFSLGPDGQEGGCDPGRGPDDGCKQKN
ncbi:MAG: type II secretion system protein GspG [Deltaproteobacteria bacterium]|nr:type II secretion system protein GspG [Deltaproteobacteria bacterium]